MILKAIKTTLLVSALALLLISAWFCYEFYSTIKPVSDEILIEVEMGKGAKSIAEVLKERGVIKKTWPFLLGYKLFFSSKSIKAGEYVFQSPISTKEVLSILTEGKVYLHPLTIPEGLTKKEIAQHLDSSNIVREEDFLKASSQTGIIRSLDKEAQDLEGYLFPETYNFPKGIPAKSVVSSMISLFKEIFSEDWKKRAKELQMTIRAIVILASLIEKETSLPEERKLISAVFYNRLKLGMKLDCDPTIIYVLKQENRFKGRLRYKDLKFDSPYNTYLYAGLPPGPICNPGLESLEAALYPADEKYLYFVSKNDGSHHFSHTFREHQNAVNKYQKNTTRSN
jgi:UPF0755 protein